MTFPQSKPSDAVNAGQEYWRLFTRLDSSGDIYEADQSARAIVIGPNSDVAQLNVTYYNTYNIIKTNLANNVTVSVDKPFIGRIDAIPSQKYQSGDRARVLISTLDLVPPGGFRPPLAGASDTVSLVRPFIDVLYYLYEEPTFIAPRAGRTHLFEQINSVSSIDPQWFLVPFYGRRFAEITQKSLGFSLQPAYTLNVYGINFSNILGTSPLADNGHQQVLLATQAFAAPGLGAGISHSIAIANRSFDYLAIEIDSAGVAFPDFASVTTHIVINDRA